MLAPNRPRVIKGGLLGTEEGLRLLFLDGNVSAERLVHMVGETQGL